MFGNLFWIKSRILNNSPKSYHLPLKLAQTGPKGSLSFPPTPPAQDLPHLPLDGFLLARANAKAVLTIHQDIFWKLSWIICGNFPDENTGPVSVVTVPKAHRRAVRARAQTWIPAWLPQLGSSLLACIAPPQHLVVDSSVLKDRQELWRCFPSGGRTYRALAGGSLPPLPAGKPYRKFSSTDTRTNVFTPTH